MITMVKTRFSGFRCHSVVLVVAALGLVLSVKQVAAQSSSAELSAKESLLLSGTEGLLPPVPELPALADTAPQAQTCLLEPYQVSEVGSPAPGVVETIDVHRGDVVEQGQTLATLNAQVDEATLALRRAEAAFMSRVTNRNSQLYKRKLLPEGDYDELQSRARQAQLQVALQQAVLAERTIKSPYAGVVVERYVGQGDRVNDNKLLKLAQIDPLLVKVVMPESQYGRIRPGDQAQVRINPAIHEPALTATVWRVDSVMDAASGTFMVLLKMDNSDGSLPAGVRCSILF